MIGRYYSLNEYLKNQFGCKVYKLALSCSNSCPNRDGSCGVGGCIFCSGGSGDFAGDFAGDVNLQIEKAKSLISKKWVL